MFISPSAWWHTTCNEDATIAIGGQDRCDVTDCLQGDPACPSNIWNATQFHERQSPNVRPLRHKSRSCDAIAEELDDLAAKRGYRGASGDDSPESGTARAAYVRPELLGALLGFSLSDDGADADSRGPPSMILPKRGLGPKLAT